MNHAVYTLKVELEDLKCYSGAYKSAFDAVKDCEALQLHWEELFDDVQQKIQDIEYALWQIGGE